MNIENIKLFIQTYQKGNFATVAKDWNLAPSSVSRAVSALEKQLNIRLFQRNTRSLSPTQAGIEYYDRILPLMEEFDDIHETVISGLNIPSGLLRISASTSFGQIVLPAVLKSLNKQYPEIKIELNLSDKRVDLIEEQIDVAIRHGILPDSTLIARKLQDVSYHLVASPEYLRLNSPIHEPEDLSQHQLITFNYQEFASQWHFSKKSINKNLLIQPFFKVTNASMIRNCVLNDMGLALLADWSIAKDIASGAVVEVLPEWSVSGENRNSAIWVVQASREFVPKKVSMFVDFLFSQVNRIQL